MSTQPRSKPKHISISPLTGSGQEFLEERGISQSTAATFMVGSATRYFRRIDGEGPAVAFPYFSKDGLIEAVKYRAIDQKDFSADGAARSPFGSQLWTQGRDILLTEGEMDTLAIAEAMGIDAINIGSVPHGAPVAVSESLDNPRLAFLEAVAPYFETAGKVYVGVDMDGPGLALAEEIVRRIGRAKCWRVHWREKDANDVLVKHGREAVSGDIAGATPWPMNGLYDVDHYEKEIASYVAGGFLPGNSTGYPILDEYFTVQTGQLTVVTGIPGSGKSEWVDQIMVNLAEENKWRFAVCSWENPPAVHIMKLAAKRSRTNIFRSRTGVVSPKLSRAVAWVKDHFLFLEDHSEEPATLDSILDRLRAAILRYGIKGAVIDPYNYIVKDKGTEERVWIEDMLAKVRRFAITNGLHIFFVAHPTKIQPNGDGSIRVPKGNDVSGSAAWFAKTDNGITVHRDQSEPHVAQVHVWKIRYQWIGKIGMTLLVYNSDTSRFEDASGDPLLEDGTVDLMESTDDPLAMPF